MKTSKQKFRILARHKWVSGATITESVRRDDATDENGISIRRFTATIRGFRNWKIYEGPAGNDIVAFVTDAVSQIRDRIDAEDNAVFTEPNQFFGGNDHAAYLTLSAEKIAAKSEKAAQ